MSVAAKSMPPGLAEYMPVISSVAPVPQASSYDDYSPVRKASDILLRALLDREKESMVCHNLPIVRRAACNQLVNGLFDRVVVLH